MTRLSRKAAKHGTIVTDHFFQASDVACATTTRCLAIITGHQATFDPKRFKRPKMHQLASFSDAAITGIACPTATECVAVDGDGSGISYDPATGKFIKRRFKVEEGEALTGSACSSKTQCTAVDNDGQEITFQPLTGKVITRTAIDASVGLDAPSGDSDDELDDVSCPGTTLCVAVDTRGAAVAFNPRSKHSVKPTLIDTGHGLTSISCPTTQAVRRGRRQRPGAGRDLEAVELVGDDTDRRVGAARGRLSQRQGVRRGRRDRRRVHRPRVTRAHRQPARSAKIVVVTGVVAKSSHEIPDRLPLRLIAGERVDASERSSEWREHVFVTAEGGTGWVPVRSLSGSSGMVTVRTAYDTTELATSAGEHLEVIKEDIRSGWLWCRSREGSEGWVPLSTLDRAG